MKFEKKNISKYYHFVWFLKILEKSIRSSLRNSVNKKGEKIKKKERHSNLNSWKQKTLISRRQTTGSYADGTRQGRSRVQAVYGQRRQDACDTIIAEQKRDRSTAEELVSYSTVRKHQKDL